MPDEPSKFVSRGGLKLEHALDAFAFEVRDLACADFGCNVGGFTDCLLQGGASHVTAVDTGYGALAWKLRQDPRVLTLERTNALHCAVPTIPGRDRPGGYDLIVIDMAWTPQRLCLPAAARWLRPGGHVITLVKPHYELRSDEKHLLTDGILREPDSERVMTRTLDQVQTGGFRVHGSVKSPILGGQGKKNASGNAEWLALVSPANPG